MQRNGSSGCIGACHLVLMFVVVSLLTVPVVSAGVKPQPMSAFTLQHQEEYQTFFLCVNDFGGFTLFSNVSHNWLRAYGYGYGGIYSFSSDDWSAIVTMSNPPGATDDFRMGEMTQYYDPSTQTTTNVTSRQSYPVWLEQGWVRLCASTANTVGINCSVGGHVSGVVIGRFSPPDGWNPLGTDLFTETITISF